MFSSGIPNVLFSISCHSIVETILWSIKNKEVSSAERVRFEVKLFGTSFM